MKRNFASYDIVILGIIAVLSLHLIISIFETRSVAQEAGDNKSPIWERHHRSGYFDHYHLGNLTKRGEVHTPCFSHAFYGLPQFD